MYYSKGDMENKLTAALSEAHKDLEAYDSSLAKLKLVLEKEVSADPQDAQELNLTTITVGKNVSWDGLQGTVVQLYKRQISKVINDEPISIEGSPEDPAVLIKDAAGNQFLRLASQVSLITQ